MAHYHFHSDIVKRSSNQSAVAAAAYRSGERLYDERLDKGFDYTNKDDVLHSDILAPEHAGEWAHDRDTLWNTVQNKERQWSNGQLARDLDIALQREFTVEENIEIIKNFAQENFVDKGMIADINIHSGDASDGEKNLHAHIMLTMKEVDEETGEFKSAKNREWNNKDLYNQWRENWEVTLNDEFEKRGIETRVSSKSYEEQDIKQEPQIHVGFATNEPKSQERFQERLERNEEIKERNRIAQIADKARDALLTGFGKAVNWVKNEYSHLTNKEREDQETALHQSQKQPIEYEPEQEKENNKGFSR